MRIKYAKIEPIQPDSFATCIVLYNENNKEIARSRGSHPESAFEWRYYIDSAKLKYIDIFAPRMEIDKQVYITFESFIENAK